MPLSYALGAQAMASPLSAFSTSTAQAASLCPSCGVHRVVAWPLCPSMHRSCFGGLLCAHPESISRISDGGCRCAAGVGIGDLGMKNTTYAVRGCCSQIPPIDCHHHLQCSGCSASACTVACDVATTSHDMEAGVDCQSTPHVED